MQTSTCSRSIMPDGPSINRAYETTYRREFVLKKARDSVEGVPSSQRFLIGCPFQLDDPIEDTIYSIDFSKSKTTDNEPIFRPNTNRASRPHPHKRFPYWPRRSESAFEFALSDETKQTLKNQINSTNRVDFNGTPQGLPIQYAYERSRPFWRHRAKHTLDSEYRYCFQTHPITAFHTGGRYAFSCKDPVDAIVPQALPLWKHKSLESIYTNQIGRNTSTDFYMKEFVDSLSEPMDS